MIIDYTYFTGLLSIGINPETGASDYTQEAERGKAEAYISAYEPEYLRRMLGESVYEEFSGYLSGNKEGTEKWERLKAELSRPYSPVACYVYFKYLGEANFQATGVGTVTSSDGDSVSPAVLQRRAWNDMARMNRRMADMLASGGYGDVSTDPLMLETLNPLGI